MCSYKRIAVTAARLSKLPLPEQIRKMAKEYRPDMVILREKELSPKEYEVLAEQVLQICKEEGIECVLHNFIQVAETLRVKKIHLPLTVLRQQQGKLTSFEMIGVSIHSVEEAKEAYELGATYLTAGHIFETECKAGMPGRGIEFLKQACQTVPIPVYAIGGINDENSGLVKAAKAAGECRMSYYMR